MTNHFGPALYAVEFDARYTESAADLIAATAERFGGLDVLVNKAGLDIIGAAEDVTDTQLRDLMDPHLFGPAALTRAALPVIARAQPRHTEVSAIGACPCAAPPGRPLPRGRDYAAMAGAKALRARCDVLGHW